MQNKEIEDRNRKGKFEGLIIGRSKSQQEIDTQIDQLAEEFQRAEISEEIQELEREGYQYSERLGDFRQGGKMDHPIPQMSDRGEKEKEERPKKKRMGESNPLEVELDLGGGSIRGI